jgi:hypothetical protein
MPVRRLPVRPNLKQLHRQAKELLRGTHARDANAIAEFHEHHPGSIDPSAAKLADAQLVLARSYGGSSWTRLVQAVQLADAIWRDDPDSVRALITHNPALIHEHVLIGIDSGWGAPMTYAANLGRDRIDLLEAHLAADPDLLTRTFDIADIFPLAPACAADPYTAQGTPVHGTTLLHIAAYFDELDIAEWLLERRMDPNAHAASNVEGFGGYTALFSTIVSQRNFWVNYGQGQPDEARFTRLLLDRGADPNIRASLRAGLGEGHGGGPIREYRDVTPLGWGEQYHARIFVSRDSLRLIEARGGGR